jgi:SAM-dependent methyltransferase
LQHVADQLITPDGQHRYPIINGIPRFVSTDHYVGSFSFEWNVHKYTQVDSHRNDGLSENTLREKTGLTPDDVRGKLVLDAGVGSGRFAEVLSGWGARVVGVDLSYAVEAAQTNVGSRRNVLICQADIAQLPFAPETFDIIISIGVLHHTPDTRYSFDRLTPLVKKGGEIAIWVYPSETDYLKCRAWVPFTRKIPVPWFYSFCKVFVPLVWNYPETIFFKLSRLIFPFSDLRLGMENAILDTFDAYSPRYYDTRAPEEVECWFREANLEDIRTLPFHTAVRGRKAA